MKNICDMVFAIQA